MNIINRDIIAETTIEFQFMCELLAGDLVTDEAIRERYDNKVIDWNEFSRLILHHRVYPLIYERLQTISNSVPVEIVNQLRDAVMSNTFYMMKLTAEMQRVTSILKEHHIEVLMLKGPVLAYELYGDLAHRNSKDLDMLVDISKVEKALEILKEIGYMKKFESPYILNSWKWKDHHIALVHPELETQIEIHWSLNPYNNSHQLDFSTLWNRKRSMDISGCKVHYLGFEDLFMYLISHGARHGWFRLRWLLDIDRLIKLDVPIQQSHYYMEIHDCKSLVGQAYYLASQLIGTPLSKDMKELAISQRSIELAHYAFDLIKKSEISDAETLKNYLKQIKSPKRRMIMLLGRLYPGPMDAELLPLPRKLHFLYIPLRPFLWMWRRIRQRMVLKGRHEYD